MCLCTSSFSGVSLRRDQLNRCKQKYAKQDNYSHQIRLPTPQISSGTWQEKEQTDSRKPVTFCLASYWLWQDFAFDSLLLHP